jgi:hypothetical protein
MHVDDLTEPDSLMRLIMIRVMLNHQADELELVRCLDTKTGDECDVVFVPAMDADGDIHLIPGFPVPVDNTHELLARYVPVANLPKSNPSKYYNN